MDYNDCLVQIQQHLQNSPLIVLGSGASITYGLPSMHSLEKEIESHTELNSDANFQQFCTQLPIVGLEEAINLVSLNQETHEGV